MCLEGKRGDRERSKLRPGTCMHAFSSFKSKQISAREIYHGLCRVGSHISYMSYRVIAYIYIYSAYERKNVCRCAHVYIYIYTFIFLRQCRMTLLRDLLVQAAWRWLHIR